MGAIAGGVINIQGEIISSGGVYSIVLNYLGGNVGIGTSSPNTQLQIDAASSPTLRFNATTLDGGAGSVQFYNQGTQKWNLTTVATTNNFALYNNGGTNSFNLVIAHSTGAATFSSSVTAASLSTTGNLNYTSGAGVNWYINPAANGPTIRLKYHGGSTDRNGALGWIDNSGNRYDALFWQDTSIGIGTNTPAAKFHSRGSFITENVSGNQYGEAKSFIYQSAFDNPTINLITINSNSGYGATIIRVTVYQNTVSSGLCNIHVGYAHWAANPFPTISKGVSGPSIQVSFNGGTNVGTLAWSGNTLQYTSNRMTNYDGYVVVVEWGSNTDYNTPPTYGGNLQ
jgi:hypothetical protein